MTHRVPDMVISGGMAYGDLVDGGNRVVYEHHRATL